ncbi:hypothetical protein Tco_0948201 [Tanacetum coccineum]
MDIPAISCPSCNANVESANHVFFECDIATDMWKLVFRWCDIPLFQASSWDSFNDWIISWHASKEKKHRFYVITTSVLWWLWRYRNSVTFSSQPLRKSDLFDNVRFSSFSWLHNRDHMKLSWNDWLIPVKVGRSQAEFVSLLGEIGDMQIDDDGDSCIWSLSHDVGSSVSKVRKHIHDCMLSNLLSYTRLPHRFNLSSRGLDINSIMCPVSNGHAESNIHVFFSCDTASIVWRLVHAWSDSKISILSSCEDLDSWLPSWRA